MTFNSIQRNLRSNQKAVLSLKKFIFILAQ